jgi:hypothetical protein
MVLLFSVSRITICIKNGHDRYQRLVNLSTKKFFIKRRVRVHHDGFLAFSATDGLEIKEGML